MASGESSSANEERKVDIILRSSDPSKLKDMELAVPLNWTVDMLKKTVAAEHPQKPSPAQQVLIYGGQVLNDSAATMEAILSRGSSPEGPYTIHLVFKGGHPLTQSCSEPNLREMTGSESEQQSARPTQEDPDSQLGQNQTQVMMPVMMVNPIVSAAYSAAMAAVYNPQAETSAQPTVLRDQTQGSSSNPQQPMVPAIAFFPLGIPVLVPANAQNQGFRLGQGNTTVRNSSQQVQQRQPPSDQPGGQRQGVNQPQGNQGGFAQHPRRRVVVYRLSLRGLVQLALIIAVLYAYCSPGRFLLASSLCVLLYIFARPIRRLIHHHYNARDADGQPRARGVMSEILAILLTLISSLFPNWNVNEGIEAGIARIVREEPLEHNPHAHAD